MPLVSGQAAFAAALLHAEHPVPAGITTARVEVDVARFSVYRNNVFVGLTKALAQRFPVTEQLVGAEFFFAMARAYAQDHQPASPLIIDYGDRFPDFVASFRPAEALAYLPDVARLESAWTRAYHAADEAPLAPAALAVLAPEMLAELQLVPHPSAHLISSDYPVGSIWGAHQQAPIALVSDWRPQTVLVARPAMSVAVHILPRRDIPFVKALFEGAPLGVAAEAAFAEASDFDFGAALIGLVGLGAFSTLQPKEREIL